MLRLSMMRKWVIKIFSGLLLCGFAALLLSYGASWYFRHKIAGELERITRAGEPSRISQLIPPEVYPLQNAAVMYGRALGLIPKSERRALDYQKLLRENPQAAAELVTQKRLIFELLASGLVRPQCRYELDYPKGFAMQLPDFAAARYIVSLTGLKAMLQMQQHKNYAGQETLAQGLKFLNTLQPDSCLLTALIKAAGRENLLPALRLAADSGGRINPNLLSQVRLAANAGGQELINGFCGERAMGLEVFQLAEKKTGYSTLNQLKLAVPKGLRLPGNPWLYYDQWIFLKSWREVITGLKDLGRAPQHFKIPSSAYFTAIIFPNAGKAVEKVRKIQGEYRKLADQMGQLEFRRHSRAKPRGNLPKPAVQPVY